MYQVSLKIFCFEKSLIQTFHLILPYIYICVCVCVCVCARVGPFASFFLSFLWGRFVTVLDVFEIKV